MSKVSLKDAEEAHKAVITSQQKQIAALYEKWADKMAEEAKKYAGSKNPSSALKAQQITQLEGALRKAGRQVANAVNKFVQQSMIRAAQSVVGNNAEWMKKLGFPEDDISAAFSSVPTEIVQNIITGQVYEGGWSLAKSIWGDNEDTLSKAYEMVAGGIAENKSVYDIAKDLEQYVRPSARKPWNYAFKSVDKVTGKEKTYRVHPKRVDYNAQRLARTLSQHAYQQTMVAVNKDNPLVQKIKWHSTGSRVCPICMERNGRLYDKNEVPMDHPNGMCILEPVYDKDTNKRLADWVNGKSDPALDKYAQKLGMASSDAKDKKIAMASGKYYTREQLLAMADYELFDSLMMDDWFGLDPGDFIDPVTGELIRTKMVQQVNSMFGITVQKPSVASASINFAEKYGTSSGAKFNYWYSKLSIEARSEVIKLKTESGLTWQKWYEKYIYKPKPGQAPKTKKPTAKKSPKPSVAGWIGKAKGQTVEHMLSTEESNFASMSEEQKKGLIRYTGSSYESMNGYLRYLAAGMSPDEAREMSNLSDGGYNSMPNAIAGLKKVASKEDLVLRRGTDLGDLAGLMQGDFMTNKSSLYGKSAEELNKMFAGHIGTYSGFTSTSSIYDRGFSGDVEVILYAPKGTQGSSVMSISRYGTSEGEFLLNAGTQVRVLKVEQSDRHKDSSIRVYMEIIGVDPPKLD